MEIPIKMDDLGGKPTISGNIQITPLRCLDVAAIRFSQRCITNLTHQPIPSKKLGELYKAGPEKDRFEMELVKS